MERSVMHTTEPNRQKGPFDGITYLYIRTNPFDNGTEPLPAGQPFWVSPDIRLVAPGSGAEDVAVAGQPNEVHVTVNNGGGISAVDAYVEAFFNDPATGITPATATLIGSGFLTIDGYSRATIIFPWSPGKADAGHRCLVARVSLTIPPDRFANSSIFDVRGDRHVAQRNIGVIDMTGFHTAVTGGSFSFAFAVANPLAETTTFTIKASQVQSTEQAPLVRKALGSKFAQFSERSLRAIRIDMAESLPPRDPSFSDSDPHRPPMGLLADSITPGRSSMQTVRLAPGEVRRAILSVACNPFSRTGDLQVVQVVQVDGQQREMGGFWLVVQNA